MKRRSNEEGKENTTQYSHRLFFVRGEKHDILIEVGRKDDINGFSIH